MSETNVTELNTAIENEERVPVLKVWQEVLKSAAVDSTKGVTPNWSVQILSQYPGIGYADMPDMADAFFSLIAELEAVLNAEIATDGDCLSYVTAEEDMEHNRTHYLNILKDWQLAILEHELDWHPSHPFAAIEVAAISEVHKLFFGQNGITEYLHQSGFQYDSIDAALIMDALNDRRGGGGE